MAETLLQTKLFVPPSRPFLISRPHLNEKLNQTLWQGQTFARKFTLVSAPAGFGKTTLISTWLSQLETIGKVAWVSLDESDNDPSRFLAYFIGALQTLDTAVGQSLVATASLPPADTAMQLLLPDITAVTQPFILVLDDYHLISTPNIHKAMEMLLAYMPPQMHLVIISRADPPFSLPKLRVRRQLTEIRARDLRFTPNEATEYLNRVMGLSLSAAEIDLLAKRTEGWIGGLQLAAHSLQMEGDKTAFLTAFAGDDRYIADYLLEEVLAAQPEAIQSFLLQSSILKRFNGSLCNAILERQDSQAILAFLEQSNLFIEPLDNRRQWYRYHHLFADLLRDRLEATPEESRQLHRRASQWFAANQQLPEAIEHALEAADYERAIELILESAVEIFMNSRLLTLLQWWQKLPEGLRTENLTLHMMMAWAWLATGYHHESEQGLQEIELALGQTTTALLTDIDTLEPSIRNGLIEVTAIRMSRHTVVSFDASERLTLCQHILPFLIPEETVFLFTSLFVLRPVVLFNMGLSYQQLGQLGAAEQAFNEAMEQGKMLGNVHIVASSFGHLAEVQIERGQLHEAAETCQRGLELLDALAGKSSPMAGLLHVQLGELFYEWNDLDTAVHHYQEGIALAQPWQNKETLLPGYSGLARAYLVAGHPQKAQTAQKALTALAASERPTNTGLLESQTEQADGDLLSLLDEAEMGERWGRVIKLRARQALRCEKMGDVATAIASLARAITLAEPEKYVRSFVDGGEAMERLLQMGMANGRLSSYAQNLLNAFRVTHDPQMSEVFETSDISRISENLTPATLIDPLSQRELEVLSLISEGLTNKEIALRLHLSVGTVKVHAHNIYGKLDVNGRTQAVAKGRALNLLS